MGAAARSRRSRRFWIALGVIVVMLLASGGWLAWHYLSRPRITSQGKAISHPERLLGQAESALSAEAHRVNAATSGSTRCYFAVHTGKQPAGTIASDITNSLYCGPVIFVDGSRTKAYVTFALTLGVGTAQLQGPSFDRGAALPSGLSLLRPDRRTPPRDAGGLVPPTPPMAKADTLAVLSDTSPEPPVLKPHPTTILDGTGYFNLTKTGFVQRYGVGDAARTAPAGQKLLVFQFGYLDYDNTTLNEPSEYYVQVDDRAKRPIDLGLYSLSGATAYGVVAVPDGARSVELIVDTFDIEQSVSLLDGRPGAENLALAARDSGGGLSRNASVAVDVPVTWADGNSAVFHVTYTGEDMYYFDTTTDPPLYPSRRTDAFIDLRLPFTESNDPQHRSFALATSVLHLVSKDGTQYPAFNVDVQRSDLIRNVFVVPASFTGGTLTISGTGFLNNGETYTVNSPVTIPIQLPN